MAAVAQLSAPPTLWCGRLRDPMWVRMNCQSLSLGMRGEGLGGLCAGPCTAEAGTARGGIFRAWLPRLPLNLAAQPPPSPGSVRIVLS